jgi:hypothetical protein
MISTMTLTPSVSARTVERFGMVPAASNRAAGSRTVPSFIPSGELLFWTRKWQEGEAESTAAREAGDVRRFRTGRDAVRWLLAEDD